MNINPISFGKIIKITGNNPIAAAKKIASKSDEATPVTFDSNKSAYIATGDDYKVIDIYCKDMIKRIETAAEEHSACSNITQIVTDIEFDRFLDLSKMHIMDNQDLTVDTVYDENKNEIVSFNIQG